MVKKERKKENNNIYIVVLLCSMLLENSWVCKKKKRVWWKITEKEIFWFCKNCKQSYSQKWPKIDKQTSNCLCTNINEHR